eukprot:CAMPEP_0117569120 /NCGR_PEP_ID=MMETSP0784-20121206/58493_1 /TAXON_ID=39447 /ORGANISM="" /LENGTH=881 /DNA_ID=CAMNT_0005367081 /DNA_START=1 /DNA_END=2646 /DNA_ORIENTATION=-
MVPPPGALQVTPEDDGAALPPFVAILAREPSTRDAAAVEEALDAWLEHLPVNGAALGAELRAPRQALLETFSRGRLAVYRRGQRLQEEGDEIRCYTILLQGRCRLRCRIGPRAKTPDGSGCRPMHASPPNGDSGAAIGSRGVGVAQGCGDDGAEEDGYALCDVVNRGESLGLAPGEARSSYEVHCVERATVLFLGAEDYAASLRPFHRELQAQIVDFFSWHRLCPQATASQLQRLASFCRLRTARRGALVSRYGESQRHVRILKSGACSMLGPRDDAVEASGSSAEGQQPDDAAQAGLSDDDAERSRQKLQAVARAGRDQQAAAADEDRRLAVLQYTRGRDFRGKMQAQGGMSMGGGLAARDADLTVVAHLGSPGTLLGEEALLFETIREQANMRYCYTIRADEDCVFYSLDMTTWRSFAMYTGLEQLSAVIGEKMQRRRDSVARSDVVTKELGREARRLQRREIARENRQKIRLPPCAGSSGMTELEDVDDWLSATLGHRKAPLNEHNPNTLVCLEGLAADLSTGSKGPGVKKMMKVFGDATLLRQWQQEGGGRRRRWLSDSGVDRNPLGDVVAPEARYLETPCPRSSAAEPPPRHPAIAGDVPSACPGIFFQTEPELEEAYWPPPHSQDTTALARSSSVPTLPKLHHTATSTGRGAISSSTTCKEEMRRSLSQLSMVSTKTRPGLRRSGTRASGASSGTTKDPSANRTQAVVRNLRRAATGKSVLVLTNQKDVKKAVADVLLSADLALCFVKSTSDLWQRLGDAKEQHHAIMLDLDKKELPVESLIRLLREHGRYGALPIVVVSGERDLPEIVRQECSFVVFKPLAAPALREALLWCFNKKALQGYFRDEAAEAVDARSQTPEVAVPSPALVMGTGVVA